MTMAQTADHRPVSPLIASSRGGPTVWRVLLGAQLRRLREEAGISRDDAAYAIRASVSKMCRLELGRVGFKERDVADLLTMYGVVDEDERTGLMSLVRRANEPQWWQPYGDIMPSWFEQYVGLEEAAVRLRTYATQFVPGLLQTEDYAFAVARLRHPHASKQELERRVELEMMRQRLLTRPEAPKLWTVIDEAALRRRLGGVAVLRGQLRHLREVSALPNVTVQILPFDRGVGAPGGPFTILRFQEPDLPDVVYVEQLDNAAYLDRRSDLDLYGRTMDTLCAQACVPGDTPAFVERLLADL
ncbi:MAG: helix-turn-helix domain-containing protein [Actinomadura rubrobrunea]|nr:helix-turn-helix domain-containing protein [Actinomadura rubrobrunea]